MKKVFIVASLMFFALFQTQAQVSFKPGLRGGANFSHFTKGNDNYYDFDSNPVSDNYNTLTNFYIGFYGALKLTKYYTLQPEIDYSSQGSNYNSIELNVDYLSIGVINKFTFSDKFNIHLGPTIDFVVSENFDTDSDVDMAFVLGAGYNFTPNFGIEARVKKGIIPVFDSFYDNHTNVVFSLGATYTFDLK